MDIAFSQQVLNGILSSQHSPRFRIERSLSDWLAGLTCGQTAAVSCLTRDEGIRSPPLKRPRALTRTGKAHPVALAGATLLAPTLTRSAASRASATSMASRTSTHEQFSTKTLLPFKLFVRSGRFLCVLRRLSNQALWYTAPPQQIFSARLGKLIISSKGLSD